MAKDEQEVQSVHEHVFIKIGTDGLGNIIVSDGEDSIFFTVPVSADGDVDEDMLLDIVKNAWRASNGID